MIEALPTVNAVLNTTAAICLVLGWRAIRRGQRARHVRCMVTALAASTLFLTSYTIYHIHHLHTPYEGEGVLAGIYFTILFSHLILAIVNLPMVIWTVIRAVSGDFARHKKIARWTLPIWLYVSVTGVIVYVMLYRL